MTRSPRSFRTGSPLQPGRSTTAVLAGLCLVIALCTTGCTAQRQSPPVAAAQATASAPATRAETPATGVPTHDYTDTARGVRFSYPVVWTLTTSPSGYLPAAIQGDRVHIVQSVVFSPEGNLYEQTNLSGLAFTYALASVPDAAACSAFVTGNTEASGPATHTAIAGVPFTEIGGSDAGMSHQLVFTIDSTWRNGQCYLFERDEATIAPGVQEGKHPLTPQQDRALQRHLREVFESVRFSPAK